MEESDHNFGNFLLIRIALYSLKEIGSNVINDIWLWEHIWKINNWSSFQIGSHSKIQKPDKSGEIK